jgi:anti-sigma B factor antagonist
MTATFEPFSTTIRRHGVFTIFELEGELDTSTAAGLEAAVDAALAGGERQLVVDLGHVAFMDPAGVAAVVAAQERTRAQGGRLVVQCPSVPAEHALDSAGVADVVEVVTDPLIETLL